MLRTQWVTRTTCSNQTSRLFPAVGMTMLTGGRRSSWGTSS